MQKPMTLHTCRVVRRPASTLLAAALLGGCLDWTERPLPCDAQLSAAECGAREPAASTDVTDGEPIPNGRPVLAGRVVNARDLGGTPLADGASVAFDVLFRGPPLARLDAFGCDEFAALGVRTIIDLRVESERLATPHAACALSQAQHVLAPLPVPYAVSPQDYIADLNTTDSIATAFAALGDEAAYPVWFHCTYGRDRSGVLAALILLSLGATREDVVREYTLSRASVGAYPLSLEGMLDELDSMGGIDTYLEAAGVSAEQRAVLDAQARAPAVL
jgi:protein-tyrosine phosphatase